MKIRPVGVELFHVDGQTDRHDEANSRFSHFSKAPTKYKNYESFALGDFCAFHLSKLISRRKAEVAHILWISLRHQQFRKGGGLRRTGEVILLVCLVLKPRAVKETNPEEGRRATPTLTIPRRHPVLAVRCRG